MTLTIKCTPDEWPDLWRDFVEIACAFERGKDSESSGESPDHSRRIGFADAIADHPDDDTPCTPPSC